MGGVYFQKFVATELVLRDAIAREVWWSNRNKGLTKEHYRRIKEVGVTATLSTTRMFTLHVTIKSNKLVI